MIDLAITFGQNCENVSRRSQWNKSMSDVLERSVELYFDHLRFIKNSARMYDAGDEKEALRMAVSLRVLFNQTHSSTAVLSHLNAFDCEMVTSEKADVVADNWEVRDGNSATRTIFRGGVSLGLGQWAKHLPTCDFPRRLKASDWWNANVLQYEDKVFSRRVISLWIANKDGGAHVDDLHQDYEVLQTVLSPVCIARESGGQINYPFSPCFRLMRQSANDLIHSIDLHDYVRNIAAIPVRLDPK